MGEALTVTGDNPELMTPGGAVFGVWTDYRIPDDRADWHPAVREFYEYWLRISPPGRLPGRRHMVPEDIAPLLPRLWMLDVVRNPLRFRYRLVGTDLTRSMRREVTGRWLDEAQPGSVSNINLRDRYRFVAEVGRPTWRRGPTLWNREPNHRMVENCVVPLATDGETVDKIIAFTVLFDANGHEL